MQGLGDLLSVAELVVGRAGTQTQLPWLENPCSKQTMLRLHCAHTTPQEPDEMFALIQWLRRGGLLCISNKPPGHLEAMHQGTTYSVAIPWIITLFYSLHNYLKSYSPNNVYLKMRPMLNAFLFVSMATAFCNSRRSMRLQSFSWSQLVTTIWFILSQNLVLEGVED